MTDTGSPKAESDVPQKALQEDLSAISVADSNSGRKSAEAAAPTAVEAAAVSNGTAKQADLDDEDKAAASTPPAAASDGAAPKAAGPASEDEQDKAAVGASPRNSSDAGAGLKSEGGAAAKKGSKGGVKSPRTSIDAAAARKSSDAGSALKGSEAGAAAEPAAADAGHSSEAGVTKGSSTTPAPPTPGTTGSMARTSSGAAAGNSSAGGAAPKRANSAGGKSPSPVAAAAPPSAAAPVDAVERKSSSGVSADELPDGSAPKVKALREQLSQNGTVVLSGGVAQPVSPEPKPELPPERRLSEHDRINTTNAVELLQSGAFKLVPGKDVVAYDRLITLRLEDGIDVTRKEEYLAAAEFATVFKMERAVFEKLPQWKRLQLKKSTNLF